MPSPGRAPPGVLELSNEEIVELFLEELYASGASEHTVRAYRSALRDFLEFIKGKPLREVTASDVMAWRISRRRNGFPRRVRNKRRKLSEYEEGRLRQATLHYYTLFLRAFFKWLGLDVDVPVVKLPRRREPQVLSEEEVEKLIAACRDLLDLVIVYLLVGSGLRARELLALTPDDVDLERGEVRVRAGKFGEERVAFLTDEAVAVLKEWIRTSGVKRGEPLIPLSYSGLYKRLKTLAKRAGLPPEKVRPHVLRHTFATSALRRGMNLIAVQRLLGHKDVKTTQVYTHLTVDDLRREFRMAFGTGRPAGPLAARPAPVGACPACGSPVPPAARFCPYCGSPLAPSAAEASEGAR